MTENTHNNVLDYQDPGELSEELLSVPGFVNELKNHTLAVAARPNPVLAFAGALAMLAHLGGASYMNERGLRTNLYLAALAPTGMGKDEPRCTNKALATAAGVLDSVPDAIASGEALEDAVAASPSLLLQTDEADSLLTAMRGGDSRATGVLTPVVVREDEPARAMLRQLKAKVDETARRCYEQDLAAASALYCRLCEKTEKLAMLYAISECPADPLIGAEAVHWGAKLATHITNRMLYETQFHVADGSFDRLKKRFIVLLAKHGGSCDRTSLLRSLAIDASTFNKVVNTLHMCDFIEEETLARRKVIYTLKYS